VGLVGALGVLVALAIPAGGQAGTSGFRCPTTGRLISIGASTHEVRTRCREPDEARTTVELRTIRETVRRWVNGVAQEVTQERTVEIPVDEWTYDFGRARFIKFLHFEYGRLLSVTEGQKGSADSD
jgi:hypothetical protein